MAYTRNPNSVIAGLGLEQDPQPVIFPAGAIKVKLAATIATKTTPGIVIAGDNINITPEGVISTDNSPCHKHSVLISYNYDILPDDYYIGIIGNSPIKVTLPPALEDCMEYIIKLEVGAPIGNRKVTVLTKNNTTIDGSSNLTLDNPYECVHVISRGGSWHIISHF